MMYLNYFRHKGRIYVKYIDKNGYIKFHEEKNYCPPAFILDTQGKSKGEKDLFDRPLVVLNEGMNYWDTRKIIAEFDSSNFPVYGYSKIENAFTYDMFKGQKTDLTNVHVHKFDIETEVPESGFPDPMRASEKIYLISVQSSRDGIIHAFYVYDSPVDVHDPKYNDYVLHHFRTESEMLKAYIEFNKKDYPDVLSGWNIEGFDIPYLYNRIRKVLGDSAFAQMSPFGIIETKDSHDKFGNDMVYVNIKGVSILDYIKMYPLFVKTPRARYTLDYIGEEEVGERKLHHHSGIPGHLLYKEYFSDAILYNIQDVRLVDRIDKKLKLISLVCGIAYTSFINYEDVFSKMRIIENLFYVFLKDRDIYFEWNKPNHNSEPFEGAAVKDTIAGLYKWIASFDVSSEYPSLIRALNISPETITSIFFNYKVEDLINRNADDIVKEAYEKNLCLAGNGATFSRDKVGFMPQVVAMLFDERGKNRVMSRKCFKTVAEAKAIRDKRNKK